MQSVLRQKPERRFYSQPEVIDQRDMEPYKPHEKWTVISCYSKPIRKQEKSPRNCSSNASLQIANTDLRFSLVCIPHWFPTSKALISGSSVHATTGDRPQSFCGIEKLHVGWVANLCVRGGVVIDDAIGSSRVDLMAVNEIRAWGLWCHPVQSLAEVPVPDRSTSPSGRFSTIAYSPGWSFSSTVRRVTPLAASQDRSEICWFL